MKYFIILFLLTIQSFSFDYRLEPSKITDNVACFFGLTGEVKEMNGGRVINTCFIESNEGYIVIDSGPTYAYAQQAYDVMQKRKALPVKYVINTSAEEIHILGNEFYKEQGATLIGPKSYELLIQKQEELSLFTKISNTIFRNTRLVALDIYQDSNKTIKLGNQTIEIKKFESKASKNLVVNLPKEAITFVGDYASSNKIPQLKQHYSLSEWLETLEKIKALPSTYILSSHGVKRQKKDAFKLTKSYLTNLRDKVLISLAKKEKKEKAMRDIVLRGHQKLAFYDDYTEENIGKAYDEIAQASKQKIIDTTLHEEAILMAMADIRTEQVLKEGSTKGIDITETIDVPKKVAEVTKKKTLKTKEVKITKKVKIAKKPVSKNKPITIAKTTPLPAIKIIKDASRPKKNMSTQVLIPSIHYDKNFYTAQKNAIKEHKLVLIKVEADHCEPCQELNKILATNNNIKKMINNHIKAIKINTSYESVPLGLTNMGTPTVFLINPNTEKVLMKLEGTVALEDLEDSLRVFTKKNDTSLAYSRY